jgi:hypothetical protein
MKMREYEQAKHRIGKIILFNEFVESEEFTTAEFRESFENMERKYGIAVRTPYCGSRSGNHLFVNWSDRIARLLIRYCDHVGKGKWRVNLKKKMWGINTENCNYYIPRCNDKGGKENAES